MNISLRLHLAAASILLISTAIAKIVGLLRTSLPPVNDPVLSVPVSVLVIIALLIELVTIVVVMIGRVRLKLLALRLTFGAFLGYRIAALIIGPGFCPCLGGVAPDLFGLGQNLESIILPTLLVLLFLTNEYLFHNELWETRYEVTS
jgi:hypothetical protein